MLISAFYGSIYIAMETRKIVNQINKFNKLKNFPRPNIVPVVK